ncbi:hypothetical protein N0824_03032 [Microcystis sp. 0824]|uniref:Uncharacterized protein n=1 Tax=Microcystis aeruginosa NIES-2549 TaxID=1641812 RepID=A0A0F6RJB5_MICAE|nr:hypothetical protein MYAER_0129 [Microcystis aeruginosa NIES-2549]AOC50883.1 hypothetical protein amyaer_0130 [Microcystis aeruginosa NIES-2481]GBF55156.1 hypothetical protein N0824_03032 [Microcystis sp. 0824]
MPLGKLFSFSSLTDTENCIKTITITQKLGRRCYNQRL